MEALLAQDGEPRMVLANNHTLLCAGTVVLPERCITLVIAQDAAPVWQARRARTRNALIVELWPWCWPGAWFCCSAAA